ncbi:MAG: SDR family NAD(P)-dependent oxidoreductase [Lentisphaeria bacterium]
MAEIVTELAEISRFFGANPNYVVAGGGNTSCKTEDTLWVKASGFPLATITEDGFAVLDRHKLARIAEKSYSQDPIKRESEIKDDLFRSSVYPEKGLRPSVETSLHDAIGYTFVVHTHPTVVNGLLCSMKAEEKVRELFGEEVLFVPYTDPGYTLFKLVKERVDAYRQQHGNDPAIILLQNHGLFVGGDFTEEIKRLHDQVVSTIEAQVSKQPDLTASEPAIGLEHLLPALRMLLSRDELKVLRYRRHRLIDEFAEDHESFSRVALPFTPDHIVYCKAHPLYLELPENSVEACKSMERQVTEFKAKNDYDPKVIMLKGIGLVAAENTVKDADTVLNVFDDALKISALTENFGGPRFMSDAEIDFIDNWEVENYRRKVGKGASEAGVLANRVAVVTGGAQGFGGGIAEELIKAGSNVVIADLAEDTAREHCRKLNRLAGKNAALFVCTNVADDASVRELTATTVQQFGGIDLFVSNAGVLRAGGLDEMDAKTFEFMTDVNYKGYFLCAKYASAVMKLQHQYNAGHFADIIQINSKSGLKGSNRNFAYAGGKFGGIGLTQSFALELAPYKIKVNSICPGNFFEGPLWADPDKGLFVQYLQAGKVPGAKTVDDVKQHYESQVPMNRGCRIADLMRAIEYIVSQEYETGQAVPVTGGQNMLK